MRAAYTLPAEASGRRAVRLQPGRYVEFVLPAATNAITVRYALPDAPNGGGITAPLDVTVNGRAKRQMTLTSQLTAPPSAAGWTVVDLLGTHLLGLPRVRVIASNVLFFGADPSGRNDSADAFDRAIAFARHTGLKVYVPPGTYRVNRHIVVDHVTIEGAGNWYTVIKGRSVPLDTPAQDGSTHTGVGFYGKWAKDGGSSNVHLIRVLHRRRRAWAHRHRPGERRRWRAQQLDVRRAAHPAHQGRHVGSAPSGSTRSFTFPATGSEFSLADRGGNDGGWLAPWMLPNTITCDDRPPVVAPPPPSTW